MVSVKIPVLIHMQIVNNLITTFIALLVAYFISLSMWIRQKLN